MPTGGQLNERSQTSQHQESIEPEPQYKFWYKDCNNITAIGCSTLAAIKWNYLSKLALSISIAIKVATIFPIVAVDNWSMLNGNFFKNCT